jgi:hypothetical protein
MNPFLSSLKPIWENPRHVFIDEQILRQISLAFASEKLLVPEWREPVFPPADSHDFVSFLGVGNAINFAFKDFDTKKTFSVDWNGQTWSGAFGMWACLSRALESGIDIIDARVLTDLKVPDVKRIFAGNSLMPMMHERCVILNEVGRVLGQRYDGKMSNLFEECGYNAFGRDGIVNRLINELPSFRDESFHSRSSTVLQFHKRAQLFPMMYQGRALSSDKLTTLVDYQDLGPIADYAVPRALRNARILRYSSELEAQVKAQRTIEKDSEEEQEIRAQTSHAQFEILKSLKAGGLESVTMLNVDYKVWSLGRGGTEPHHLTITTSY